MMRRHSSTAISAIKRRSITSGINTELFVGEESLQLYSAMQGLDAFLNKAFFRWCAVKGIDPDSIKNNPPMLTYFPDPDNVDE